ncbi:MAG: YkgJ family cysteine cluster protein [Candidatus Bathyarchaeia archaeon]|nr:YkgJ family cysteine cluster protein [Candidatus Bathyarchaeota archaeon]
MSLLRLIPWRRVHDWLCLGCGECCKRFEIPLMGPEYARVLGRYGLTALKFELGRVCLNKRFDGRCVFQYRDGFRWLCGLQQEKPISCKLWPFAVFTKPRYGRSRDSAYRYLDVEYYLYVHPSCRGLTYGSPSVHLAEMVLPEVIEIWLGKRTSQSYTTCHLPSLTPKPLRVNVNPL